MNAHAYRFIDYGTYEPVEETVRVFVRGKVAPIGGSSLSQRQPEPLATVPFDARANLASVLSDVRSGIVKTEILAAAELALQRAAQPMDTATWSIELARELAAITD